jgi:dTDP-4-dehydrorhamnose reductase
VKRVLVFGKYGQVARCLDDIAVSNSSVQFTFLPHTSFDNGEQDSLRALVDFHKPNLVVNLAAFTNVDEAEDKEFEAMQANAILPQVLARVLKVRDIPLIHISTDYVFDGEKVSPYLPQDTKNPISVYGRTKSLGEDFIQEEMEKFWILRTSWVYSPYGRNFFITMLGLLKSRDKITVVSDQFGSPTSAHDLAREIMKLILNPEKYPYGIYHASGLGKTTWWEFAQEIQNCMTAHGENSKTIIEPIESKDYNSKARRPKNSLLASEVFELPYWPESIKAVYEIYKESNP